MKNIRIVTFSFPFGMIALILFATLLDSKNFIVGLDKANTAIINHFSWLINGGAFFLVCCCVYLFFAPVSQIRIGGKKAEPLLSPFKWFSISLTTAIAMGILFWAAAEPVLHFQEPPSHLGIEPRSSQALGFSMQTILTHWTITPYAIYTATALSFALGFYNKNYPYSIGTLVRPIFKHHLDGYLGQVVDGVALLAVIFGMAGTLSAGIMAIANGYVHLTGQTMQGEHAVSNLWLIYALITAMIMTGTILAVASGLQKGIQVLARTNAWLYFMGLGFIFLVGPTSFLLSLGVESLGIYLTNFMQTNLVTGVLETERWAGWWTVAYFASWFGWAPITCLFLGYIARGYTVRQFIVCNLLLPSLFGWLWFSAVSGSALFFESAAETAGSLYEVYNTEGFNMVIYALFDFFPGSMIISALFVFVCFITFITAADANTEAVGAICTKGISPTNMNSPLWIKVTLGTCIGFIAWVSSSFIGVDGVRSLYNLAGIFGAFICIGAGVSVLMLAKSLTEEELKPKPSS